MFDFVFLGDGEGDGVEFCFGVGDVVIGVMFLIVDVEIEGEISRIVVRISNVYVMVFYVCFVVVIGCFMCDFCFGWCILDECI